MTKRMLIDSTHAEETRVVVLDGNRLEDFDVETSTRQQLKGNIYLAKVVRVEPSLQAAFVEYGGNRHGFLAFGEIHPDYYQIPVADRQRLLDMQEAEAREDEEAEDRAAARDAANARPSAPELDGAPDLDSGPEPDGTPESNRDPEPDDGGEPTDAAATSDPQAFEGPAGLGEQPYPDLPRPDQVAQAAAISQDIIVAPHEAEELFPDSEPSTIDAAAVGAHADAISAAEAPDMGSSDGAGIDMVPEADAGGAAPDAKDAGYSQDALFETAPAGEAAFEAADPDGSSPIDAALAEAGLDQPHDQPMENGFAPAEPPPESMGGETEEPREQRAPPRFLRNYKIQEVIRRRQILLIQVVKEERGTKGAALTTYISLAGRFSVLMPNSPRGGGISRKITSASDRRRLKEVTAELDLPRGMGLIVRTAGANRPKPEIIRDCEYLLSQWDQIRDLTMKSVAPALIYEEASLIKRAIRDVYSRDVDDILVDGEQGWRAARDFMRMLMPTHARKVQLWKDPQPLFVKAQVEAQLDAMMSPTVQLKSGGYLVINQTEALVAIDVNSGRSTRERGIEETALKTNLEAADEAARQLRLRDLAGLIVIDFIDMESRRNNTSVEARLKNALKNDRARIQIGSISHFGLLEMSRQRLRPSLAETSFVMCPHCAGTGQVRSTESAALHVLRGIEEEGAKRRAAEVIVHVAGSIALYILNYKRLRLSEIETRYGMRVAFAADDTLLPPMVRIDRVRAQVASELPPPISQLAPPEPFEDPDEEPMERAAEPAMASDEPAGDAADDEDAPRPGETAEETEQRSGRRRRRRRGGRREDASVDIAVAGDERGAERQPQETGAAPGAGVMEALSAVPSEDDAPAASEGAVVENAEGLGRADSAGTVGGADSAGTVGGADSADAPSGDEAERSKRRGRRGGRRRRREPDEAAEPTEVALDVPEPASQQVPAYAPPVYAGPTPANPFGGTSAFDIFDAIEQAEQERAIAATTPARRSVEPALSEPGPTQPAADLPGDPEPVIAEPVALAPETVSVAEPAAFEDPATPEPAPAEPPGDAPSIEEPPAAEPVSNEAIQAESEPAGIVETLVKPVVIDGTDTLVEKKRGWWRR